MSERESVKITIEIDGDSVSLPGVLRENMAAFDMAELIHRALLMLVASESFLPFLGHVASEMLDISRCNGWGEILTGKDAEIFAIAVKACENFNASMRRHRDRQSIRARQVRG